MACIEKVKIVEIYFNGTKEYDIEGDNSTNLTQYSDAATGSTFFNLVTKEIKFATRSEDGTVTWN